MTRVRFLTDVTDRVHDRSHEPTGEENWQESWYLAFYDPVARAGGSYHLGLQPPRNRADVWNWTVCDGRVIGHFESLDLPLPEHDLSDMDLGGLDIVTTKPLREYAVKVRYPDSDVTADIKYEAITEPYAVDHDGGGVEIGSSHYESFGRVTGTIREGGVETKISTWAYQDHSWGPRSMTSVLSHRWIVASFGDDLFMSVAGFVTASGVRASGYVFDGEFRAVESASFGAVVADDGYSPLGCDALIRTTCGRGYRVTGKSEVSSFNSHDDGWFAGDGMTVFEMGGRVGTGLFEVSECKALTPRMLSMLGRK